MPWVSAPARLAFDWRLARTGAKWCGWSSATYAIVAVGLLMVALVASWVPARRAARTDPATALRHD
ncbi:MAG: hypothetical protein ACRD2N_23815 [Vicinamibacterales bacterium]